MFETGAERYTWINNILAVGVGERLPPNMVRRLMHERPVRLNMVHKTGTKW
jgi:hypothetical protein